MNDQGKTGGHSVIFPGVMLGVAIAAVAGMIGEAFAGGGP